MGERGLAGDGGVRGGGGGGRWGGGKRVVLVDDGAKVEDVRGKRGEPAKVVFAEDGYAADEDEVVGRQVGDDGVALLDHFCAAVERLVGVGEVEAMVRELAAIDLERL